MSELTVPGQSSVDTGGAMNAASGDTATIEMYDPLDAMDARAIADAGEPADVSDALDALEAADVVEAADAVGAADVSDALAAADVVDAAAAAMDPDRGDVVDAVREAAADRAVGAPQVDGYDPMSRLADPDGVSTVGADDASTVRAEDVSTVRAEGASDVPSVGAEDVSTVRAEGASDVPSVGAEEASTVRAEDASTVRAEGAAEASIRGDDASTERIGPLPATLRFETPAPTLRFGYDLPRPAYAEVGTPREVGPADGGHGLSSAEIDLRTKQPQTSELVDPAGHVNAAYKLGFSDGTSGIYKPQDGESIMRDEVPEGQLWNREIATSRLDEAFGFDLVPTTTAWDGHRGTGSMQEWRDNVDRGLPASAYSNADQQMVAVLDYVTANSDRHRHNYLTSEDGHPVAIDHGYTFPEGPRDGIRSDFVVNQGGRPFEPEVLAKVRAVDPSTVADMLSGSGLSPDAVNGALARLGEVQSRGAITGEAYSGPIFDANWGLARGAIR